MKARASKATKPRGASQHLDRSASSPIHTFNTTQALIPLLEQLDSPGRDLIVEITTLLVQAQRARRKAAKR